MISDMYNTLHFAFHIYHKYMFYPYGRARIVRISNFTCGSTKCVVWEAAKFACIFGPYQTALVFSASSEPPGTPYLILKVLYIKFEERGLYGTPGCWKSAIRQNIMRRI
jgi:hypothetical protein